MKFSYDQDGFLEMQIPDFLKNEKSPTDLAKLYVNKEATAISKLIDVKIPPQNTHYNFSKDLQQQLFGRKLLFQELPFPIEFIHEHYRQGFVTYHKGITGEYVCERCGNSDQHLFSSHECARCNEVCIYCRKCVQMGKVSQCSPLVTWVGPPILYAKQTRALEWQGVLSEGQQQASDAIVASIGSSRTLLVWAVCGAGKTEILFEGINKALQQNQSIVLATPRRDVVHELSPRLKKAFPNTSVVSLFGGSEDKGKTGQLVLSTTHQLLRYEHHFDVVIIDEVDAFPYSYDPMLQFATTRAAKRHSTTIFLTATPAKLLQKSEAIEIIKIPKRFHGYPLPVPRLCWCGNWRNLLKKGKVPSRIIEWLLEKEKAGQQTFLFVPSVKVLTTLVSLLQKQFKNIEGVHAQDPERSEKVSLFRKGDIQLLLTTTILERGVTVPNVAVAVFGADDSIFTEKALVQIAGRAGRSSQFPTADIVYFHYGKTEAMLDAIDHIKEMNRLGGF